MTATETPSPAETLAQLRAILCDDSANLALRFRALFSLKHLATNGDLGAVDAIAAAFSSDSGRHHTYPYFPPRCTQTNL